MGRRKTIQDFKGLLAKISMDGQVFNLMSILTEVHKLDTWPLFQIMVGPDERQPIHNILKVYGIFSLSSSPR